MFYMVPAKITKLMGAFIFGRKSTLLFLQTHQKKKHELLRTSSVYFNVGMADLFIKLWKSNQLRWITYYYQ